jgi:hypothetical protein
MRRETARVARVVAGVGLALVIGGWLTAAVPVVAKVGLSVTHITPPPQPPLALIAGRDLTPVRDLFNREADRPRILVLLSPT